MKFEETTIPHVFRDRLEQDHGIGVDPKIARFVMETLLLSTAEFLALIMKEEDSAVVVNDEGDNLLLAGVVSYHKNEDDADMPGNYSFVLTTNPSDLDGVKESNKHSIDSNKFLQKAASTAYELHSMRFMQPQYVTVMLRVAVQSLLEWLDVNAKDGEELSVELDGYFVATVGVEEGVKVISIVPDGALKRKIKDDAELESKVS